MATSQAQTAFWDRYPGGSGPVFQAAAPGQQRSSLGTIGRVSVCVAGLTQGWGDTPSPCLPLALFVGPSICPVWLGSVHFTSNTHTWVCPSTRPFLILEKQLSWFLLQMFLLTAVISNYNVSCIDLAGEKVVRRQEEVLLFQARRALAPLCEGPWMVEVCCLCVELRAPCWPSCGHWEGGAGGSCPPAKCLAFQSPPLPPWSPPAHPCLLEPWLFSFCGWWDSSLSTQAQQVKASRGNPDPP